MTVHRSKIFTLWLVCLLTALSHPRMHAVQFEDTPEASDPFFSAIVYGKLPRLKALIRSGRDPNQRMKSGITPLMLAVGNQRLGVTEFLLEKGADPNLTFPTGEKNSLLEYAVFTRKLKLVKTVVAGGCFVNVRNAAGESPFYQACANKDYEIVHYLIEQGVDIDEFCRVIRRSKWTSPYFVTPLISAAIDSDLELTKILVEAGAKLNHTSWDGDTALACAARAGAEDIVRYLIEKGADVNSRSYGGHSPILYAAHQGKLEIVKMLFEAGADPHAIACNRQIPTGKWAKHYDPFYRAASGGHHEVAAFVLAAKKKKKPLPGSLTIPPMPELPDPLLKYDDYSGWPMLLGNE